MKSIDIAVSAFVALATAALTFGCSSSSGGTTGPGETKDGSTEDKDSGGGSKGDSGGGTGGMSKVICSQPKASTPMCSVNSVPSADVSIEQKACGTGSAPGTIVTACPTKGLTGCCTIATSEICYYSGGASDNGCTGGGAKWTTTP